MTANELPPVATFVATVADLVAALNFHGVSTIDDLGAVMDTAGPCQRLEEVIRRLIEAGDTPENAADDAFMVALAAQIVAEATVTDARRTWERVAAAEIDAYRDDIAEAHR